MPLTLNETLTCSQLCLGSLLLVQAAHLYVNLRGIRENMPCDVMDLTCVLLPLLLGMWTTTHKLMDFLY